MLAELPVKSGLRSYGGLQYDRYKEMQVCFSSEYAVKLLKRIDL